MLENDYAWLLKTISSTAANINLLYNLKVKIPEIILLKSGEPKMWFYQDKDQIKSRNENFLKLRLVKEYFVNPEAVDDLHTIDFDYMAYISKQNAPDPDAKKILFCVNIEQPSKDIKVIKKISKRVCDDLFSQLNDNMEFCKQWTKVFSYIPNKNAGLYEVLYTKGLNDENPKLRIVKKDFSLKDIQPGDFGKNINREDSDRYSKHDKLTSENNYASIATTINSVLEKTIKSVARFLEGKTKLTLGELHLELVVDANYVTWLIGSKGIHFYNHEGELDREADKEALEFPKTVLKHYFVCPGSYCRFAGETNFHQEGDEAINIYDKKSQKKKEYDLPFKDKKNQKKEEHETPSKDKKPQKKEEYEIPFKSVILDIIERWKQIDRLKTTLTDYSQKHIMTYVETHPFDFRKYYSIGEILQSYLFKGYRVSNLYRNINVCKNCHFIYEKIDGYRLQKILKNENRKFNAEDARATIGKYFEKNSVSNPIEKERNRVFSKAFYEKLQSFDKELLEILGLEKDVETLDDFFELTSAKMRRLSPVTSRSNKSFSKSLNPLTPPTVRFPAISKETIRDPHNFLKKERLTISDKTRAEMVGYKHFLGHAMYLTESGAGFALSKSSIKLNKLQDKLNRFNVIIDEKLVSASTKDEILTHPYSYHEEVNTDLDSGKEGNRSESLLTRKFNGLQDTTVDASTARRKASLFNVAVDKFDFISDKEKAALSEKESKKREKEMQQKNFLATNSLLAKSISGSNSVRGVGSTKKNFFIDMNLPIQEEDYPQKNY